MALPLRAIAVFHAVARSGSLTKAASELFVTTSAVSQQIQNLGGDITVESEPGVFTQFFVQIPWDSERNIA